MSKALIKEANQTINQLVGNPGPRTYGNTVEPLALFESWISSKTTPIGFYTQVSDNKDVREAAKQFEKEIGDFQTDLWMREDLYQAFSNYVKSAKADKTFSKLNKETQRYVNKTL